MTEAYNSFKYNIMHQFVNNMPRACAATVQRSQVCAVVCVGVYVVPQDTSVN